jgi:hypothetical protein
MKDDRVGGVGHGPEVGGIRRQSGRHARQAPVDRRGLLGQGFPIEAAQRESSARTPS